MLSIKNNILILLSFFVVFACPTNALSSAMGTMVAGCAESGGLIATPMGVAFEAEKVANAITLEIIDLGKMIESEQTKTTSAVKEGFKSQNEILRDLFAGLGTSQQKIANQRNFGANSIAYGMNSGSSSDLGVQIYTGLQSSDKLKGEFVKYFEESTKNKKIAKERFKQTQEKDIEDVSFDYFSPRGDTLSAEQLSVAKYMLSNIIDPFPSLKLPKHLQDKGEKIGYTAQRKIKYSRLALPTAVLSGVISSYAPTVEVGDYAQNMLKILGNESGEGIVDGKISPIRYLKLMTNMRFANNSWLSGPNGIHSKTKAGLLRELLIMQSVEMEMQRRQMMRLQQSAALLAQEQAIEVQEKMDGTLESMYRQVISNP